MPSAPVAYRLDLHEIGRGWWLPEPKILTAEYVPTSTLPAGVLRQVIAYDTSSITRSYSIAAIEKTRADMIAAMMASGQTTWAVDVGTARFECTFVAKMAPLGPVMSSLSIDLGVVRSL
jgi:hypothetical protein